MDDSALQLVIDYASLAPSVHNTQPWRFTAGDGGLEVRADWSRRLEFLDPDGRQLRISCGAAIEFARLALRSQDLACAVRLQPDPADPDLLARLETGGTEPVTELERELVEAMPRRYTDRQPYTGEPLPAGVLHELREAAEHAGAWLKVIDDSGDRVTLATILEDAEAAEAASPAYAEELARWTRDDAASDGISRGAISGQWPEDVVSDVPLRDFTGHARHPRPGAEPPRRVERDTLILLGSGEDDATSWLIAGCALAAVLLRATARGVSSQPLGPATDFPDSRRRLRHELRLVGHPQFLLRLGYGHDQPRTARRPATDSLTRP